MAAEQLERLPLNGSFCILYIDLGLASTKNVRNMLDFTPNPNPDRRGIFLE